MAVSFTQTSFRFRNDDGSHTTATWKAAADTNISADVSSGDVDVRIRFALQEVGTTAATFAANLFMSYNGGSYAQVGSATSRVKAVDSANLTDNATTTQQISVFTYVSGRVDDVDGTTTATASIVQNSGTEFEFMVRLVSADLDAGDLLDFRVYRSGVAVDTYDQTARIVVQKTSSDFVVVEFYNGTAWADITSDVLIDTMRWVGGIRGSGPADRAAMPGSLELEVKNGTSNSGGLLGYYSPDHANCRSGWALGAKIRVRLTYSGDTRYWMHRIKTVKPIAGKYGPRRVEVTGSDYIAEMSERKVSGLLIANGKHSGQLLPLLIAGLPFAPTNTSYGTGVFNFPYAFHTEQDESTYCLSIAQKISQSDMSYTYSDGDATDGETLTLEPHTTRLNKLTSSATLSDTMTDLDVIHSKESVLNYVTTNVYPVEVGGDAEVLGQIRQEFTLAPGETQTITIPYLDEITEGRISGDRLISPEENTDYRMSAYAGSGGKDLNASLTVTPTAGANTMSVVVTNGAAVTGYVNTLQIRGYTIKTAERIGSKSFNQASIDAYGEKSITHNMPYMTRASFGQAVADEIIRRNKDPHTDIIGVTFSCGPTHNTTLLGYALTLGIGARVTITETATGVNADFFVNGFEYELESNNKLNVTWILERAWNTTQYFTIDDATFGAIDGAYLLAPF